MDSLHDNKALLVADPDDPTAESRKQDHIQLAFAAQVAANQLDGRFFYEPLLAAHPSASAWPEQPFLGKSLRAPLWVSSMTGGTRMARTINHNLARACGEFGMGMGLGSCRSLLRSNEHLSDFYVRPLMGEDLPLFANLGIAQVEQLLAQGEMALIRELVAKLEADGLIVHVNPLQEWLQPEGDRFRRAPIETIAELLALADFPIIVKEVGQGMGRESLRALMRLPLAAIDFAASGGTNFAKLELARSSAAQRELYGALAHVGHSATDMVGLANALLADMGEAAQCRQFIISGGIRSFLDGYYCIEKLRAPSVYGQASAFLKHAQGDYAELRAFVASQIEGLALAKAFLVVRD